MAKQPHQNGRRSFFKKAALCAGALFLVGGAGGAESEPEPSRGRPRKKDARYRLTDHVRKYYDTAMR